MGPGGVSLVSRIPWSPQLSLLTARSTSIRAALPYVAIARFYACPAPPAPPRPAQAAMLAYAALCESAGTASEPFMAPMLPVFLERLADKVRSGRGPRVPQLYQCRARSPNFDFDIAGRGPTFSL